MPHDPRKLVYDVIITCEEMMSMRTEHFEAYMSDRVLQLATERQFEIIGEALSRLARLEPELLQSHIPEFRHIIGFRNVIAHGYDVIDQAVLWDFSVNKVPQLLEEARGLEEVLRP